MDPELRAMFQRVTKGALSGNTGQPAKEDFKINGQYVNTPVINGQEGVVSIPFLMSMSRRHRSTIWTAMRTRPSRSS